MHSKETWLKYLLWMALSIGSARAADFNGDAALEFARKAVAFGQRPAGSAANKKLQAYIEGQLKLLHCQISADAFTAQTPVGAVPVRNIIAKFPGKSGRAVAIAGHFDTKAMPGRIFLGANDGGSSAGFLLEMARVVNSISYPDDIYLVFFDGEEAFGEWSETNGIYGSRHLAEAWAASGVLGRIRALINVDMIGDKELDVVQDSNSSLPLLRTFWHTATDLGYGKYFLNASMAIEDDHMPFRKKGVNAIDLIDFDYGPDNSYWHTEQDTIDKISAHSLQVVGAVVLEVLRKLQSGS